ncbi:MAG: hypothetical protein QXE01_02805 [Sulfolobales archaeon]
MPVGRLHKFSLYILASLLIIGFLGIGFLTPLPPFLLLENLAIAFLLALGLLLSVRGLRAGLYIIAIVSLVYSGRISRSIISPIGTLQPLWEAHVPVAVLLLALGVISILMLSSTSRK